jgi:hypothetical protein
MRWTDGSHKKEDAPHGKSRCRIAPLLTSILLVTGLADVIRRCPTAIIGSAEIAEVRGQPSAFSNALKQITLITWCTARAPNAFASNRT